MLFVEREGIWQIECNELRNEDTRINDSVLSSD